ncbi:hypothetical protein Q31b_53320 [Novipirellula aureliae]|uniref:Uncharacterized protein n=1 Tax=Novipirellula aureliae TaxID=2527966 RepID=A0A5C6DJY7_9BACT|nr:hypothetical protein Q31b_53320 [Novipirellula aureliae]
MDSLLCRFAAFLGVFVDFCVMYLILLPWCWRERFTKPVTTIAVPPSIMQMQSENHRACSSRRGSLLDNGAFLAS